jgi:cellulose synthase/poly-beta-1,6-N-acetylglucosamine synthase-like glycosyltransferase
MMELGPDKMFTQVAFLTFSLIVTLIFFIYGFNHYYLLSAARRYKSPELPLIPSDYKPGVAIHLPVFNEKYVIHRLIAACARMAEEYGIERVKIFIIDDSDDETADMLDKVVEDYREKHFQIEVLRRGSRQGFKAGALQMALEKTEEEFIAIFDADFIPTPDFLVHTVPYFFEDERLGIIQSRWTHLDRDYNLLTGAIAIGIDVHFLIEQAGRYAAGCFQNFNGSGGILRRKALCEAGGWQSDTLAEDLDASYRIQLQGYRILYLRELQSPGEVPPTVPSYKKQQGRWACGSLRTAKKLLPSLVASRDLGVKKRLEAFIHLTGYMVHPLMFASFILACLATFLRVDSFRIANIFTPFQGVFYNQPLSATATHAHQFLIWSLVGLLILLCTVAAWIPPFVASRAQSLPVSRILSNFVILFLLGVGISLNNTIEAAKALLTNRNWAFKRTPKYAIQYNKEGWRDKRYQVSLDFVCFLELVLVCLGSSAIGLAVWRSNFGVLLILVPFTAAYAFVSTLTILQSK